MPNSLLQRKLLPWRWLAGGVALVLAGGPLFFLILETARYTPCLSDADWGRVGHLYVNTLLLVAGALLVVLPAATLLAALLFRSDLPGRQVWRGLLGFSLFIPLPIVLSAWQALLGADGWLPLWENRLGQPWTSGLLPAIWVHALAGLPWATLLIGAGLSWVERDLEEDALLRGPPWSVFRQVTLPRAAAMVQVAAFFLAVQTAGEIAVADMFLVNTLAEDVYLRFASGERTALALSVFASLPLVIGIGVMAAYLMGRLARESAPLDEFSPVPLSLPLGPLRWPGVVVLFIVACLVVVLPVLGLVLKLGRVGPAQWSADEASVRFFSPLQASGGAMMLMTLLAFLAAALTALGGLLAAWFMHGSRWLSCLLGGLALLLAALPAPVIGIALKEMILWLASAAPGHDLWSAILHERGPLPVLWAQALRFWPHALAVFWVLLRLVPREYVEAARLEGKGVVWEGRHILLPLLWRPLLILVALLMALCLGEVAVSSRVETPGWETPARVLFDRMHYGVDGEVAGWALMMLTGTLMLYSLVCVLRVILPRERS